MCTSPFTVIKRNGLRVTVECGQCTACRIARAREWATRVLHEKESWRDSSFVTLTYKDLPAFGSLEKEELQKFFKRLRKQLGERKLRYYACGEYGEIGDRPHYHAILFGVSRRERSLLEAVWNRGFVHTGSVTYDSAKYTADYIGKALNGELGKRCYVAREAPFMLVSKGLGKEFVVKNRDQLRSNMMVTVHGARVGLPRYYRKLLGLEGSDEWFVKTLAHRILEVQRELDEHPELAERLDAIDKENEQADMNLNARLGLRAKGKL